MAKKKRSGSRSKQRNNKTRRSSGSPSRRASSRKSFVPSEIGDETVRDFCEAAAKVADAESRLEGTGAFRIDAPNLGFEGLIACRVDFDEAGTGFLVLPSVERYRDLTTAADHAPIDRSGISVIFASMALLPKPMRRELDRFGWTRSDDDRLPLLSKQGVDGEELVSTADDYRAATLAASVMAHLARSVGAALVDENEALHCTLQIPGAGPVEVLHPGDLDEDELGSIIEDRIEVNLIVPEEAITVAREVEFLSPKARGVLARARPSEARPGFEMRATLEEMAHLGEQLKAAARQRGRSEILVEFATNVLMASESPDSMAVTPRPDDVPIVRDPDATHAR